MLVMDTLTHLAAEVGEDAKRFVQEQIARHPNEVNAVLRAVRPVFVHDGVAFVTRFDDVVEVLTHDQEFVITEYVEPMRRITGDFILGLNQGPRYERDASLLRLAFRQSDVPAVADLFRLDRPDSVYLHFGAGLHGCFGRYVNPGSLTAIARAVLSLDGVRRAPGPAGELTMDGNFPRSLTLEFTATP
jgi:cytochrome P450